MDYHNPHENEICNCGVGKRLVKCRYDGCFQYPISCSACFIKCHRHLPFHWVLEWDTTKRIWIQRNCSQLSDSFEIQLGHVYDTEPKPCTGTSSSIPFIVTHTTGIHVSRLRFCGCLNAPDRFDQLMDAKLFPATVSEISSPFTFAVLKDFHMQNFQSKCGAFDYLLALRHLTDNVFTAKVPVSSLLTVIFPALIHIRIPIRLFSEYPVYGMPYS